VCGKRGNLVCVCVCVCMSGGDFVYQLCNLYCETANVICISIYSNGGMVKKWLHNEE
jgi:hypothetical protein